MSGLTTERHADGCAHPETAHPAPATATFVAELPIAPILVGLISGGYPT